MALLQKGYLGATPLFRNIPWFAGPQVTASTLNTAAITVTASATPHTKGAWSEVIASTTSETTLLSFVVTTVNTTSTNTATLLDIGVGAAGSETVIVPDLAVGAIGTTGIYTVPVKIPSGSRIAARSQSVVASKTLSLPIREFVAFDAGDAALTPTTVDVLGVDTATSEGTSMSGSSGTWVEIVASTSQNYSAFMVAPSSSDANTASLTDMVFELGVGAAGSEVTFGRTLFSTTATEQVNMRRIFPLIFGREVPAGSRLAVRHNIAANPDKYDACIIAVPKV